MDTKTLKIIAANSILESTKLSTMAKTQLMNFVVKEANDQQLKSVALDQKISSISDKKGIEILEQRFNNYLEERENQVISDSIDFMLCAREVICNLVESKVPKSEVENIKKFIMTEASDYQIAYMLINEKFPNEVSNKEQEKVLFEQLNSLTDFNLVPIFEYKDIANSKLGKMLSEGIGDVLKKDVGKSVSNAASKAKAGAKSYIPTFSRWAGAPGRALGKVKTAGKVVLATVIAAIVLKKAMNIYRNRFSSEARACANAAEGREMCMKNARMKALDAQISSLQSSQAQCNTTDKPEKCKNAIASSISNLMAKKRMILAK